jgi:hypothetical protein
MGLAHIFDPFTNLVKSGYRSNAFSPIVWFISIIFLTSLGVFCFTDDVYLKYGFGIMDAISIFYGMYFSNKLRKQDPNLLLSEKYRLEEHRLEIIRRKGKEVIIQPVNLTPPPPLQQPATQNQVEEGEEQ